MFLKVSVEIGGTWSFFDPSPLLSMPYSLTARTAIDDLDRDPLNEKIESTSLAGSSIVIVEGGETHTIDMTDLIAGGSDNQQITLSTNILSLERGGSVDLSQYNYTDPDDDPNNEKITTLTLSGTILMINENGSIKSVNLAALQDGIGNDNQQLSFIGNVLYLERGGDVNLSSLMDGTGTDDQQLSLIGDNLILEDGGGVSLAGYHDNPFTMSGDTLALLNGSVSIGSNSPMKSKLAVISQDDLSEDALFEVRRADGQTVFAVYNEGVRIYLPIEPVTKGPRGGFAIGGFDKNKGIIVEDYLWVTPDSIRMYIDQTPELLKGPRGGFAIGGFDRNKLGLTTDYFMLSADSTRFYIDDTNLKGPRGGFAIGGFDKNKGLRQDYMKVTVDSTRFFVSDSTAGFGISNIESGVAEGFLHMDKQNYFIGHQTGINSRPADGAVYNSFIGYNAGKENTTGRKNVFLGFRSGEGNKSGFLNVFLGNQTGLANDDGNQNIFIGEGSGMGNVSGDDNVFIGINSGQSNNAGSGNLFLGPQAGQYAYNTSGNVLIGYQSGALSSGSNNVFLGSSSGLYETNSFKLVIENNPSYLFTPLIYGDFVARTVHINGTLSANSMAKSSDSRLKKEIESVSNILPSIMRLNTVSFYYDQKMADNFSLPENHQFGLIAQELELIFPELVSTDSFGFKNVDYTTLFSLFIPAIQELKIESDSRAKEIELLKKRQIELEDRLLLMEQMLLKK
jgi:hypothetical protein